MISLNFKSVTDEIFALTALRGAVTASPPDSFPPSLSRDNLPALRVAVRTAFSILVARLMPYVDDSSVDDGASSPLPYDSRQEMTLGIDFGKRTASLTNGSMMVLKRYLEHLLALTVLEKVYLPVDASIAAEQAAEASSLIPSVIRMLDPGNPDSPGDFPGLISPAYL